MRYFGVDPQKSLPFQEFQIRLADVEICTRPDGSPWVLGQGSFGTGTIAAVCAPTVAQCMHVFFILPAYHASIEASSFALMTWVCQPAVYKALKGVETVAVKSCQSVVNEREEVRSGWPCLTSLGQQFSSNLPCESPCTLCCPLMLRSLVHCCCSNATGLHKEQWASCGLVHAAQARFHREVAILKACRNRNIVSFLGQFADDHQTWLIMEYMEVCHGQDL